MFPLRAFPAGAPCGRFLRAFPAGACREFLLNLPRHSPFRSGSLGQVRIRLGHFDPLNPLDMIQSSEICSPYAIATSMAGPIQSSALLKNTNSTLPFTSTIATGSFAVVGPNANLSESDSGYYGPHNCCGKKYWNVRPSRCAGSLLPLVLSCRCYHHPLRCRGCCPAAAAAAAAAVAASSAFAAPGCFCCISSQADYSA